MMPPSKLFNFYLKDFLILSTTNETFQMMKLDGPPGKWTVYFENGASQFFERID